MKCHVGESHSRQLYIVLCICITCLLYKFSVLLCQINYFEFERLTIDLFIIGHSWLVFLIIYHPGPLLLTWFNLNHGMDISNYTQNSVFPCRSKTRQHSTQSVGNMPPPSPPHLLPQVLQIMPRNPKYDQFQPKGHHNEENPQSTTKMPGNPKFYPFH